MEEMGRDHVSPLGSLEAAAMKLSAAVCNLFSYTVADRWKGGGGGDGGGGGRRKKYLVQHILVNCVLQGIILKPLISTFPPFLTSLNNSDALKTHLLAVMCWSEQQISYRRSAWGRIPQPWAESLHLKVPSAVCHNLYLEEGHTV